MTADRIERAAVALVTELQGDWPVEKPDWSPDVVEHWQAYKASWRAAAARILAAADGQTGPLVCVECGSRLVDGECSRRQTEHRPPLTNGDKT